MYIAAMLMYCFFFYKDVVDGLVPPFLRTSKDILRFVSLRLSPTLMCFYLVSHFVELLSTVFR
jgi:hypothetical protein